jgi:transmembrane sensor
MDKAARSEAIDWLIRLQERPDDRALDRDFRAWLAASPAHAAAWAETRAVGDLMARTPPLQPQLWAKSKPARRTRRIAAAALALAAAIAVVCFSHLPVRLTADYATGTAELLSVALPDGSTAQLAPDSALDVDYAEGRRRVTLLSGAAFFAVARDAAHPFTVRAGDTETTVLGTEFDVRLGGGGTTVAVRRGAVQVANGATQARLAPGDWIRTGPRGAVRGKGLPEQAGAWTRGELAARDMPVGEVVEALRAYFHGAILVTDRALAAERVTGLYALGDPAQTLRAIALTQGASLRQISPWLLVLSKD